MANALTFIESNVEDLTKEERLTKNISDLKDTHESLMKNKYSGFMDLKLDKLSEIETYLILQVL